MVDRFSQGVAAGLMSGCTCGATVSRTHSKESSNQPAAGNARMPLRLQFEPLARRA